MISSFITALSTHRGFPRAIELCITLSLAATLSLPGRAEAATITINAFATSSGCTLINAINSANSNINIGGCVGVPAGSYGDDTIIIPPAYATYTLSFADNLIDGFNALPSITSNITIEGLAPETVIKRGQTNDRYRLMHVAAGANLTLKNIILMGGDASDGNPGTTTADLGGAIYNKGSLTLKQSKIERSKAKQGGGIYTLNRLTIQQSKIYHNTGNGIFNSGGIVSISDSLIQDNTAINTSGGGIVNTSGGSVYILRSLIYRNSAGFGGGIWNAATLSVKDSTFSKNSSLNEGGAISVGGTLVTTLLNVTISENEAAKGGGIAQSSGKLNIINSLISGNKLDPFDGQGIEIYHFSGTVEDHRNNLIGHSDISNAEAIFGSFPIDLSTDIIATSNGPRPTSLDKILHPMRHSTSPELDYKTGYSLPGGSPAIDSGVSSFGIFPNFTEGCFTSSLLVPGYYRDDQRGINRPQGQACDIGAYEYQPAQFFIIPAGNGKTVIFGL